MEAGDRVDHRIDVVVTDVRVVGEAEDLGREPLRHGEVAFGVAGVILGLSIGTLWLYLGLAIIGIGALQWLVLAWSDRATGEKERDEKLETLYRHNDWKDLVAGSNPENILQIRQHKVPYVIFENEDDVTTMGGTLLGERIQDTFSRLWAVQQRSETP